jgi:hypothetical protein
MSTDETPPHLLAVIGFDRARLAGGTHRSGDSPSLVKGWLALFDGLGAEVAGDAHGAEPQATGGSNPGVIIEATALRALALASAGEGGKALELARQASRMAQVEGLPVAQFLASIVLARMRRGSGRPHMALHILTQLASVAPSSWRPWIAWESLLAGRTDVPPGWLDGAAAPRALADVLEALRSGDAGRFRAHRRILRDATAGCALFAREGEALLCALDPSVSPSAGSGLDGWLSGATTGSAADLAVSLYGIGAGVRSGSGSAPDREAAVLVLALPGAPGRRLIRLGASLVDGARLVEREPDAEGTGAGARAAIGLATLALAGPAGVARDTFFRTVYGFPFVAERHRGVLEVLAHRMRARLGDAAEIDRDDGRLALRIARPILLADPRCALPLPDRLVRSLIELGTPSAADAARALGLPLRTVQAALQQLVAEGTCRVERHGRHVGYRVEDTTFTLAGATGAARSRS